LDAASGTRGGLERFPFELNRKDSQIRCDVIHHGG
jgi:hypothetical protein